MAIAQTRSKAPGHRLTRSSGFERGTVSVNLVAAPGRVSNELVVTGVGSVDNASPLSDVSSHTPSTPIVAAVPSDTAKRRIHARMSSATSAAGRPAKGATSSTSNGRKTRPTGSSLMRMRRSATSTSLNTLRSPATHSASAPSPSAASAPTSPVERKQPDDGQSTPMLRYQFKQQLQRQQCMQEEERERRAEALAQLRAVQHEYETLKQVVNPTHASYMRISAQYDHQGRRAR